MNVDAMLRTITWPQFLELMVFEEIDRDDPIHIDPREDKRFALLASVVAGSAGAIAADGTPYTYDTFLRSLDPEHYGEPPKKRQQTVEEMETHILDWISGSNSSFRERGYIVRGR